MRFLRAVSHSVGAHTDAQQPRHDASISDEDDADEQPAATASPAAATATTSTSPEPPAPTDNCCEVCLIGQRDGVALVPCGHARFCTTCVQSHRLERVVPTYAPAGVRSRGFVAAMFCPSGCGAATGAIVHSHSLTQ